MRKMPLDFDRLVALAAFAASWLLLAALTIGTDNKEETEGIR
jgi:hypothetical protein